MPIQGKIVPAGTRSPGPAPMQRFTPTTSVAPPTPEPVGGPEATPPQAAPAGAPAAPGQAPPAAPPPKAPAAPPGGSPAAAAPVPAGTPPAAPAAPGVAAGAPPAAPAGTPPAAPAAPVVTKEDAWRFAQIAQRDKALRQERAQLKAEQDRLAGEQKRLNDMLAAQEQRRAMYAQNPMLLLRDHGLDYNQLSEFVAKGGWTPEQIAQMEIARTQQAVIGVSQKLDTFAAEQERIRVENEKLSEQRQKEAATQAEQAAVTAFKESLAEFVQSDPETWEMLNQVGQQGVDWMFEHIEQHYEATGQKLPTKVAAQVIEDKLLEQAINTVKTSKKIQAKLGPPAPVVPKPAPRTLSNRMAPAAAAAIPPGSAAETESERRARVIAQIEQAWAKR